MQTRPPTFPACRMRSSLEGVRSLCFLALLVVAAAAHAVDRHRVDQGWQFRQVPSTGSAVSPEVDFTVWRTASMPGTVHTDLLAHNLIPDPYVGAPEADLQWIGLSD